MLLKNGMECATKGQSMHNKRESVDELDPTSGESDPLADALRRAEKAIANRTVPVPDTTPAPEPQETPPNTEKKDDNRKKFSAGGTLPDGLSPKQKTLKASESGSPARGEFRAGTTKPGAASKS